MKKCSVFVLLAVVALVGCSGESSPPKDGVKVAYTPTPAPVVATSAKLPVFSLDYSEYPSWAAFGVAADRGLINPAVGGKMGTLEVKYGVDVELRLLDYDTCLTQYGSSTADAACIANTDSLSAAVGRPTTAIMTTSTSFGADAILAVGIDKLEDLKGVTVYGLENSVSQFNYTRILEKKGLNVSEYPFSNKDPGAASQEMQTKQPNIKAIAVWEPFVMQTLRQRTDAKKIVDSTIIPNEIFDLVLMGNDSLKKDGGESFAVCICDTFYQVNQMLADPKTSDATYVALGEKFSSLGLDDMKKVCTEVKFFGTKEAGIWIFSGEDLPTAMKEVERFCVAREIVKLPPPKVGYNEPRATLNFDSKYMQLVK